MVKSWLGMLLVAAVGVGGWVAAGPFLTMRAIDRAVRENDQALLDRNVDFAILRRNLKPQVSERLREKAGKSKHEILGALAEAYSDAIADQLVEALITPAGIGTLLDSNSSVLRSKKKKRREPPMEAAGEPVPVAKPKPPVLTRWFFVSPDEFAVKRQKGQKRTTFVLNRYGLNWKLTNIFLPERRLNRDVPPPEPGG